MTEYNRKNDLKLIAKFESKRTYLKTYLHSINISLNKFTFPEKSVSCFKTNLPTSHQPLISNGGYAASTLIALKRGDLKEPKTDRRQPTYKEFDLFQCVRAVDPLKKNRNQV